MVVGTRLATTVGIALFSAIGAAGCVTYESVKATAALGQKVAEYADQFDEVPFYCNALRQETPGLVCDLQRSVEIYEKSARVVGMYADALSALASGDALGTRDQIDAMFALVKATKVTLPRGLPADAISSAINALVDISVDAYKKGEIRSAVARAGPHVAALAEALRAAARVQRDQLDSLALAVETARASAAPPPGVRVAVAVAAAYIRQERARVALYEAAVASFAAAHRKLETAKLDTRDEDLLLLKSIFAVTGAAIKDAAAPAPAEPGGRR
jgi:hypothetical protein